MNAVQRAWRYITRRPTKTVLLIITFFLIGNLVILGLGVAQASDNAKILTRQQMRAAVSYEVDYNSYWRYIDTLTDEDEINEAYNHYPRVEKDIALKLAEDDRVKAFNYMANTIAYSHNFEHVPVGNEENRGGYGSYIDEDGVEVEYVEPDLMVYANLFPAMIEFEEGTFSLAEGRMFTQNDIDSSAKVVLITKELAEQNGFRTGDTLSITTMDSYTFRQLESNEISTEDMYLDLEIIGIFDNANEVDPNAQNFQWMSPYESPKNILLMPLSTYGAYNVEMLRMMYSFYQSQNPEMEWDLDEMSAEAETPSRIVYLLNDPLEVEDFVADHENDIGEYTMLNANNDTFKKLARPLDTMSFFANIVVWIVVINAIVIISLVTALTLKTREYEIGVLLSIGVSKVKIILQLFVELILIALLGFTLATVSGSLLAGKVGDAVLDYQTTTEAQYDTDDNYSYSWSNSTDYFTTVTQDDLLSQYHVSVSPKLILEIYLLGAGVVLVAIVIPTVMIMRLNPKQILLEQN